jgi:hypothetical protein
MSNLQQHAETDWEAVMLMAVSEGCLADHTVRIASQHLSGRRETTYAMRSCTMSV